jgi:hypothetical protein
VSKSQNKVVTTMEVDAEDIKTEPTAAAVTFSAFIRATI